MKVAVAGSIHGDLDKIYSSLCELEIQENVKAELLIVCGNVLAVRNPGDFEFCTLKKSKKHIITSFGEYYSGLKVAPVLTLFVGGKYESIKYNSELPFGGWVCPNIYYMGYSNVIHVGGLRIAGLSGFFDPSDYQKGHFEGTFHDRFPKLSMCHIKKIDVLRLKIVKEKIDIFVSYELPSGILEYKPNLRSAMNDKLLGNRPSEELLNLLKPSYWFAGSLPCKFKTIVKHNDVKRPVTKFLALDNCQEGRKFLEIIDIHKNIDKMPKEEKETFLEYDPEWLSILQNTDDLHSTELIPDSVFLPQFSFLQHKNDHTYAKPMINDSVFVPDPEQLEMIEGMFNGDLRVPENFEETAPNVLYRLPLSYPPRYINPQTVLLCERIGINDPRDKQLSSSISCEKIYDMRSKSIGFDPLNEKSNYGNLPDTPGCEDISTPMFNSENNSNVSNLAEQMKKLTKLAAELNQKFIELKKLFEEANKSVCRRDDIEIKDDFSTNSSFAEVGCKNTETFNSEESSLKIDVNAVLETCDNIEILKLDDSREIGRRVKPEKLIKLVVKINKNVCKDIKMKDDFSTNSK